MLGNRTSIYSRRWPTPSQDSGRRVEPTARAGHGILEEEMTVGENPEVTMHTASSTSRALLAMAIPALQLGRFGGAAADRPRINAFMQWALDESDFPRCSFPIAIAAGASMTAMAKMVYVLGSCPPKDQAIQWKTTPRDAGAADAGRSQRVASRIAAGPSRRRSGCSSTRRPSTTAGSAQPGAAGDRPRHLRVSERSPGLGSPLTVRGY